MLYLSYMYESGTYLFIKLTGYKILGLVFIEAVKKLSLNKIKQLDIGRSRSLK
jgi:hypothetical protein